MQQCVYQLLVYLVPIHPSSPCCPLPPEMRRRYTDQTALKAGIAFCFGISITFFFRFRTNVISLTSSSTVPKCSAPIVYNKPHKTASTTIQRLLAQWSHATHRPFYRCSPYIQAASMMMRECVPKDATGCAVVGTHVILSPVMRSILQKRLGEFLTITSTRDPRNRVLSLYLQTRETKSYRIKDLSDLQSWLRTRNPWELYNYHTGENHHGICPLTEQELALLPDAVNRFDIIIDAEEPAVSNTILQAHGLFNLTRIMTNRRGAKKLSLDSETAHLLNQTLCVESEIHRLFRLRMASMYGRIKRIRCLPGKRHPRPCFEKHM